MWRRSNGAKRFTPSSHITSAPFVKKGSVLQFDRYPPGDAPPTYPPPAGSPAASG